MRSPGMWNYPRAVRTYTCVIDGIPVSKTFYHRPGLNADALSRDLNTQFQTWLELMVPGARTSGRVTHIQFSDGSEDESHPSDTAPVLIGRDRGNAQAQGQVA